MTTTFGLDGNISSNNATFQNPAFNNAIKETGAKIFRVFGSAMNDIHWRLDKSTPDNVKLMWDVVGCELNWGVNMISKLLRNQVAMFEYIKSINLPVQYFELANETNRIGSEGRIYFENAKNYSLACKDYIAAIKEIFPDAQPICVGGNKPDANKTNADLINWNETILEDNPDVLLAWHHHTEPQYVFNGIADISIMKAAMRHQYDERFPGITPDRVCATEFSLKQGVHEDKAAPDFISDAELKRATTGLFEGMAEMGVRTGHFRNVVGADGAGVIISIGRFSTWLTPTGYAMKAFMATQ